MSEDLQVKPEEAGARADAWLARRMEGVSRSTIQSWMKAGRVRLKGEPVPRSYRVRAGDCFEVEVPDGDDGPNFIPREQPLEILYEDSDLVAVNKAPGVVVHPGVGTMPGTTLVEALCARYGYPEEGAGPEERPGVVHRLDRETSGVILWARTVAAWEGLSAAFKERRVTKIYLAVVQGRVTAQVGRSDKPIGRHVVSRMKMSVQSEGKPALTEWSKLGEGPGWSLLRCRIHTGRTHQIRVHLAAAGFPVAGDRLYGFQPGQWREGEAPKRVLLHAWQLELEHPGDGKRLALEAPVPGDMGAFVG